MYYIFPCTSVSKHLSHVSQTPTWKALSLLASSMSSHLNVTTQTWLLGHTRSFFWKAAVQIWCMGGSQQHCTSPECSCSSWGQRSRGQSLWYNAVVSENTISLKWWKLKWSLIKTFRTEVVYGIVKAKYFSQRWDHRKFFSHYDS